MVAHSSRKSYDRRRENCFQGGSEVLGAIVSTNVPDMDANEEGGSRETEYSIYKDAMNERGRKGNDGMVEAAPRCVGVGESDGRGMLSM